MTIGRVKPSGWTSNEVLTSAQETALDINASKALDRTAAGDTLSGLITVASGAGLSFSIGGVLHGTVDVASLTTVGVANIGATGGLIFVSGAVVHGSIDCSAGLVFNGLTAMGGTTARWGLGTRTLTRVAKTMMFNSVAVTVGNDILPVGIGEFGLQELDIPDGATLKDVRASVDPHAPIPPGTPIKIFVYYRDITSMASTTLFAGSTDPTTGGSYGAPHTFLASSTGGVISHVVDRTKNRYFARLAGEGAGAGADVCDLYGFSAIFQASAQDDGAA